MSYEIVIHPKLAKSIKELLKFHRAKLSEFLDSLRDNPVPFREFDIRKLRGYQDRYRVRLGDFRLTYQIDGEERVILVLKIEKRGRAYKK